MSRGQSSYHIYRRRALYERLVNPLRHPPRSGGRVICLHPPAQQAHAYSSLVYTAPRSIKFNDYVSYALRSVNLLKLGSRKHPLDQEGTPMRHQSHFLGQRWVRRSNILLQQKEKNRLLFPGYPCNMLDVICNGIHRCIARSGDEARHKIHLSVVIEG